jgi:excisionase family DNA binding protein
MAANLERNFYTPHEVAALEGAHVQTVRKWIKDGLLPAYRAPGGRAIRVPKDYAERIARDRPNDAA